MYRRALRRRRRLSALALLLAVGAALLTVRAGPVAITPAVPGRTDAGACAAAVERLPDRLDHDASRPVTPESPYTAAWGRPAITLSCGLAPVADPVSAAMICLGGVEGTSTGALCWFQDVFDPTLWVTRVAPRFAVHIPSADGFADVLDPVTAAALGH